MATVMGSELFQLLKEHQEAWTNILTAVLTKLESIERKSTQTDAAAHPVENKMIIFNPKDEARVIQAEPTPFSDTQSVEAPKCTSGNVLSFPESDQQQETMMTESFSTDSLYLNNSKTNDEKPVTQISERGTTMPKDENRRLTDGQIAIRSEDDTEEKKYSQCGNPPSTLTYMDNCKAHIGTRCILLHNPFDNSPSRIKISLKFPVCCSLLTNNVKMPGKLNVRQLHRIHQPLESDERSDSNCKVFLPLLTGRGVGAGETACVDMPV